MAQVSLNQFVCLNVLLILKEYLNVLKLLFSRQHFSECRQVGVLKGGRLMKRGWKNDFALRGMAASKGSRHPTTIKANSMRFVIISHYTRNDKPGPGRKGK